MVNRDIIDNSHQFSYGKNITHIRYAIVDSFQRYFTDFVLCTGFIPRAGSPQEDESCGNGYHFYKKGALCAVEGRLKVLPHVWLAWKQNKAYIVDLVPPGAFFLWLLQVYYILMNMHCYMKQVAQHWNTTCKLLISIV